MALARALVVDPKVLLLDEPLSNLDANLRLEMRRLIRVLQQELGITTILVTHDQEEAVMLGDRVALMMDGRLLQFDEPRSFYARPRTPAVARFFRNENFLAGRKCGTVVETELGTIVAPHAASGDAAGDVLVTVRPEHVKIVCDPGPNCLPAQVRAVTYLGTSTWVEVAVGGNTWTIAAPPDQTPTTGARIYLGLPATHVWLMPNTER